MTEQNREPEPAVEAPAATEADLDETAEHDTASAAAEPASDDPRDPRRDESDYVDETPAPDAGRLADDNAESADETG